MQFVSHEHRQTANDYELSVSELITITANKQRQTHKSFVVTDAYIIANNI